MGQSKGRRRPQSYTLRLLDSDIEIINQHSAVRTAERKLRKAIKNITGWRLAATGGVPKDKFHLLVAYEDALGALKQALIQSTYDRVFQRLAKLGAAPVRRMRLGSGPKKR
jgi:hypothetical protein